MPVFVNSENCGGKSYVHSVMSLFVNCENCGGNYVILCPFTVWSMKVNETFLCIYSMSELRWYMVWSLVSRLWELWS